MIVNQTFAILIIISAFTVRNHNASPATTKKPSLAATEKTAEQLIREKLAQFRSECIAETQVNPEAIDKADKGEFPDDNAKLKCFAKCFYQRTGLVDAGGEILFDTIKARVPPGDGAAETLEIIDKCKGVKGTDACDTVYLAHKCYFVHSKALGRQ